MLDPAWDMPKVGWLQQGSFESPVVPPSEEPDAEPLVCLPAVNRYWLPYVMGALDQLRNPSSWLVADDAAMSTVLAQVSKLREMLGIGAACMSYLIRFDGTTCQLQQSTDGGTTWTEVDGWPSFASCLPPQTQLQFTDACLLNESFDNGVTWVTVAGWAEHFGPCVQDNVPITGPPPNPDDRTHDQMACSIADYLANQVILEGLQAATTAITDDLSLLAMADSILNIIPEFILVRAFVDGASIVYTAVQEGTLSDFEAALTDATLWGEITCAIYNAIRVDGYVTPANCAAISANVHAIGYTPSAVQLAIDKYVSAIGCAGLAQLSQRAGLVVGATCVCGWCYNIDFTATDGGFVADTANGSGATYVAGVGWIQATVGSTTGAYIARSGLTPTNIRAITLEGNQTGPGTSMCVQTSVGGVYSPSHCDAIVSGHNVNGYLINESPDTVYLQMGNSGTGGGGTSVITHVTFQGDGANPFGANNC